MLHTKYQSHTDTVEEWNMFCGSFRCVGVVVLNPTLFIVGFNVWWIMNINFLSCWFVTTRNGKVWDVNVKSASVCVCVNLCVCVILQTEWRADCHSVWSCSASPGLSPFTGSHPQRHQEWLYTTHIRRTGMMSFILLFLLAFSLSCYLNRTCFSFPHRSSFQTLASVPRSVRTSLRGSLSWGHPIGWLLRSSPNRHMALRWGGTHSNGFTLEKNCGDHFHVP